MSASSGESISTLSARHANRVVDFMTHYWDEGQELYPSHQRLLQSIRYSLLQEGGKRFRPVLAMLTAEALGHSADQALPFAAAVECVHTYSLIHDDLPAMDNDDFRRGLPTNHKKFDEATAILAGDALLTEAFKLVASAYSNQPQVAIELVSHLATASGFNGMVGGQAIDMGSKKEGVQLDELRTMHRLKTGALIEVAATGAALACGATEKQLNEVREFAENLGLAFQVADDLLDYVPEKPEPGSYPALLGKEGTVKFLKELTATCLQKIADWPASAEPLRQIARYNASRER
jgi:geranylgeranyl diphosphate synthase, type II